MDDKRFKSCPFGAFTPNDGHHEEFSWHNVMNNHEQLPMGLDILFRTVKRMVGDPIFGLTEEDGDIQVFHFNRVKEDDGSAAYDFKQVTLPRGRNGRYAYIVLEVISRPKEVADGPVETFVLRGISLPLPNPVMQENWCNSDWAWSEWNNL